MFLVSCSDGKSKNKDKNLSDKYLNKNNKEIRNKLLDTLKNWQLNNLTFIENDSTKIKLDNFVCINSKGKRLIGAILSQYNHKKNLCGGINYVYGENLKEKWYFWTGSFIFIPQEMNPNFKKGRPISFDFLHQQAIKNIFKSYLNSEGEINENWFKYHFNNESPVGFRPQTKNSKLIYPKNKSEYDTMRISYCKGMWIHDRYDAKYKLSDFKLNYNKKTKDLKINLKLKTPDSIYLRNVGYMIHCKHGNNQKIVTGDTSWYIIPEGAGYFGVNRFKDAYINQVIPNVPENGKVTFFIDQMLYLNAKSKRMGPFYFEIKNGVLLN
jgi:hypothetical protein